MPEAEIAHEGVVAIGDIRTVDGPADLAPPTVKFVHYPGAQQLIMWLPKPAHEGYDQIAVTRDGTDIERASVSDRVNGSVQILFRTLDWPPGEYRIVVTHAEGWRHEVALKKHSPDDPPPPEPARAIDPTEAPRGPIVYRDGFGNVIPDADLELRARAQKDIARKFARRLEYEGNYRAGTIVYLDGERRIEFFHEMCGGDMKFSIDLPAAEEWEARTSTPLSLREEIIAFVAERVRIEKASSWRYVITPRSIDFY